MPCYITGSAEGDAKLEAKEARVEATNLARLLCSVCRKADQEEMKLPVKVQRWWSNHKKIDEQRKAREKAREHREQYRQSGLAKLSAEEKAALGL